MTIHGLHAEDFTLTQTDAFIRLRREKGNARQRADRVLRLPIRLDSISQLLRQTSILPPGRPLFPKSTATLSSYLVRLSRAAKVYPPPLGRFTCRSLRSGSISAAHALGVPNARIKALSGHSSSKILLRHYIDASVAPCDAARELFGRLLAPSS
jgi:hypothetical protein